MGFVFLKLKVSLEVVLIVFNVYFILLFGDLNVDYNMVVSYVEYD